MFKIQIRIIEAMFLFMVLAGVAGAQSEPPIITNRSYYDAMQDIHKGRAEKNLNQIITALQKHKLRFAAEANIIDYARISAEGCGAIRTVFDSAEKELFQEADDSLRHIEAVTSGTLPIEILKDYWSLQSQRLRGKHGPLFLYDPQKTESKWIAQRRDAAETVLAMNAKIESYLDPTWDPNERITTTPPPPPSAKVQLRGASYENDENPKVREEYWQLRKEHIEKNRRYFNQSDLRKLQQQVRRSLREWLVKMYSKAPENNDELMTLMVDYSTSTSLAAEIMLEVNEETKLREEREAAVKAFREDLKRNNPRMRLLSESDSTE